MGRGWPASLLRGCWLLLRLLPAEGHPAGGRGGRRGGGGPPASVRARLISRGAARRTGALWGSRAGRAAPRIAARLRARVDLLSSEVNVAREDDVVLVRVCGAVAVRLSRVCAQGQVRREGKCGCSIRGGEHPLALENSWAPDSPSSSSAFALSPFMRLEYVSAEAVRTREVGELWRWASGRLARQTYFLPIGGLAREICGGNKRTLTTLKCLPSYTPASEESASLCAPGPAAAPGCEVSLDDHSECKSSSLASFHQPSALPGARRTTTVRCAAPR